MEPCTPIEPGQSSFIGSATITYDVVDKDDRRAKVIDIVDDAKVATTHNVEEVEDDLQLPRGYYPQPPVIAKSPQQKASSSLTVTLVVNMFLVSYYPESERLQGLTGTTSTSLGTFVNTPELASYKSMEQAAKLKEFHVAFSKQWEQLTPFVRRNFTSSKDKGIASSPSCTITPFLEVNVTTFASFFFFF